MAVLNIDDMLRARAAMVKQWIVDNPDGDPAELASLIGVEPDTAREYIKSGRASNRLTGSDNKAIEAAVRSYVQELQITVY